MLAFQAQPGILFIGYALLPDYAPVELVRSVKLDPWLGRKDLHHASAFRFVQLGDLRE